jgi:hypothetical protein
LAAHALLLAWGAWANSATFDEPAHLAAGVEYWERGDFSIYSLSPPLLRLWGSWPAVLAGANAPGLGDLGKQSVASRHWAYADWFARQNLSRFAEFMLLGRLGMVPISCFAGWVTFAWARRSYGWRSGVAACALYCFNPGVLANGALMTTDIGTAAAMLAACWLWWKYCRGPSVWGFLIVLVAVVAAHLCKFTAVLIWPMLLAMAVPYRPWQRGGLLAGSWLMLGVATLVVINAVYGFRGTFLPLSSFQFESQFMKHVQEKAGAMPSPVPRTLLIGFDAQKRDSGVGYQGFLFGEVYRGARWYFFPAALLCKSPLGLIALVLVAAGSVFRRQLRGGEWSVLLALAVFAAGVLIAGDMNIGTRYLLPMFPPAFVLMSRVWSRGMGTGWKRVAGVLVVLAAAETMWVCPRFLTFMNVAAGGASNGWRVLNNSDFDWGQGLIDLRNWMHENNVGSVQLAYYGFADPRAYGIEYVPFTDRTDLPVVAISSDFLDGLQQRILKQNGKREWIEFPFYRQLQTKKPIAVVGGTIFIYSRFDVESAMIEDMSLRPR